MPVIALVTGHEGFVGRHMVEALRLQGYEVIGLDIASGHDCREFFRRRTISIDLVVHCAAVVGGRSMIDGEPLRLATEDLTIDAELFRWALRARPGKIVYFSSSAAYPVALQLAEDHRALEEADLGGMPDATYGWVKLTGERLAAEANAEGIKTFVFRPFSGYGEDQPLDYPFPAIVRRAVTLSDEAVEFPVWGHPGSVRDWVHIDDVVQCVLAALEADDVGPMNICTGIPTTFTDLAVQALQVVGRDLPVVGDTTKPAGVFWRVGDPLRMRQIYTPIVTLSEGIERAVAALSLSGLGL